MFVSVVFVRCVSWCSDNCGCVFVLWVASCVSCSSVNCVCMLVLAVVVIRDGCARVSCFL